MTLRQLITGLVALALFAAGNSLPGRLGDGGVVHAQGGAMPPPTVTVVTVTERDIAVTERLPGRTTAYRLAEVRPQVNGIITRRLFEEGALVEQGEALYQIDSALYEAAVATAEAALQTAEANAIAVRLREERYGRLLASRAVSQQEVDDTRAALAQAEAAILSAEAALRSARINLDYTRVYAPISGQISQSLVTEGALVSAGQTEALAVITQLDPIFVDVMQSSAEHMALRPTLAQAGSVPVTLELATGTPYQQSGELQFSSVFVSESTGSVQLRALFPNPEQQLLPGLFVHASLQLGSQRAVLVPQQAAIRDGSGGLTVWRVQADNTVTPVPIVVDRALGDQWLVREGVSAGDILVLEGFQKIAPGLQVQPVQ
ncbi:MAG: efflux RND transporter periplasmic adaptor subunit [Pseudomonadota bacterium]